MKPGEVIKAFPLAWPEGWKRTGYAGRVRAKFKTGRARYAENAWVGAERLTVATALRRVREELRKMGGRGIHDDDVVVSTNIELRLDGLPRSGQREPEDPGAAVYWRDAGVTRCMAIDRYDRVADNIAAIAATLDAMRAIERHGGAAILDRAFTGFTALPSPVDPATALAAAYALLGVSATQPEVDVRAGYRNARALTHPDRGGSPDAFIDVQAAWETICAARGFKP